MEKDIKIMLGAFPTELESDIESIFTLVKLKTELYTNSIFEVSVDGNTLIIPERIYYQNLDENELACLSTTQQQILDCFFTRHHNGYVRQEKLNRIFARGKIDTWVIPYLIKLLGEYIVEIIGDIYKNIDLIDEVGLKNFIKSNQSFILTTEGRIASYWGEYYQRDYKKEEYVGFKIKKHIQSLRKQLVY